MATIEDFVLRMKVEGQGTIKQVSGSLQDLKGDLAGLGQQGGAFGNTINGIIARLGPLGVAASIVGGALAALGGRAVRIAGEMQDIAGSTGIATGVINNFGNSLIFAGGKSEDAANILQRLNQSVQEAASGNETLQNSFRTLGIFVTDAGGAVRSTQDILQDLTNKFQSGELSAAEYTATIDILGRQVRALELSKLTAVDDPAYTRATADLDRLNDAIDILSTTISTKAIKYFGEWAMAINEGGLSSLIAKITEELGTLTATILNLPTDAIAGVLNLFGAGIENPVGLGTPLHNVVERAKRDRLAFQAENVRLERARQEQLAIVNRANAAANAPAGPAAGSSSGGGFGAIPEATIKAREDALRRIALIEVEQARQTQLAANTERLSSILAFADEESSVRERANATLRDIEINAQAEIAKARIEIYKQERLSREQLDQEFAAKE
jgi:hypothetical protein